MLRERSDVTTNSRTSTVRHGLRDLESLSHGSQLSILHQREEGVDDDSASGVSGKSGVSGMSGKSGISSSSAQSVESKGKGRAPRSDVGEEYATSMDRQLGQAPSSQKVFNRQSVGGISDLSSTSSKSWRLPTHTLSSLPPLNASHGALVGSSGPMDNVYYVKKRRSMSPKKRPVSPELATRMAAFNLAQSESVEKEMPTLPLRIRTKSLSYRIRSESGSGTTAEDSESRMHKKHASTSVASFTSLSITSEERIPPLPTSQSTSNLIRMYEERTRVFPGLTSSPAISTQAVDSSSTAAVSTVAKTIEVNAVVSTIADPREMFGRHDKEAVSTPVREWVRDMSDVKSLASMRSNNTLSSKNTVKVALDEEDAVSVTSSQQRLGGSGSGGSITNEAGSAIGLDLQVAPSVSSGTSRRHEAGETEFSSLDYSQIVLHGDLMWLNSSSRSTAPVWQTCRAIITQDQQFCITWSSTKRLSTSPGGLASGGQAKERVFDLRTCQSATSVRRTPAHEYKIISRDGRLSTDMNGNTVSLTAASGDGSMTPSEIVTTRDTSAMRMHVFELVWPGRSHRFACETLGERVKWLGAIFSITSRYSHSGSTVPGTPSITTDSTVTSPSGVVEANKENISWQPGPISDVPRRELEPTTRESLYASVSDMFSVRDGQITPMQEDMSIDVFRAHLKDSGSRKRTVTAAVEMGPTRERTTVSMNERAGMAMQETGETPLASPRLPLKSYRQQTQRGAWSETDRASVHSDGIIDAPLNTNKAVARDLRKILATLERNKTVKSTRGSLDKPDGDAAKEEERVLKDMHAKIEMIAQQMKTQVDSDHTGEGVEERNTAEKIDKLLLLCQ